MFTGDINMLILDEATNYLDIHSLKAIETALKEFKGTILFVSHDRKFISEVADHLMIIKNNKLKISVEAIMNTYESKTKTHKFRI